MQSQHTVLRLKVEQQDLFVFSHRELLVLFIEGGARPLSDYVVPVVALRDSDQDL